MLAMNECMDIDKPDASNRSAPLNKENGLYLYPASPNESGIGLPYAPENWPNPGDKWGWKAGNRVHQSGYFLDRYLYPPSNLTLTGKPVQKKRFASKISVKQFVQAAFPDNDVSAFFASFHWKILSKQNMLKEIAGSKSHLKHDGCKAGNTMCISLSESPGPPLEAMFCDICCSEPRFCRDCCCILCCKTIDSGIGDYSYIRCKKTVQDGCICGHLAHIECALRASVAGTVGGSIGLDAEYFCRRCDSKTDLVFHVVDLFQTCETIDSRDDIDKILSLAICMLRGSRRVTANQLLQHIESAAAKLKTGLDFEGAWNKEAFEDTDMNFDAFPNRNRSGHREEPRQEAPVAPEVPVVDITGDDPPSPPREPTPPADPVTTPPGSPIASPSARSLRKRGSKRHRSGEDRPDAGRKRKKSSAKVDARDPSTSQPFWVGFRGPLGDMINKVRRCNAEAGSTFEVMLGALAGQIKVGQEQVVACNRDLAAKDGELEQRSRELQAREQQMAQQAELLLLGQLEEKNRELVLVAQQKDRALAAKEEELTGCRQEMTRREEGFSATAEEWARAHPSEIVRVMLATPEETMNFFRSMYKEEEGTKMITAIGSYGYRCGQKTDRAGTHDLLLQRDPGFTPEGYGIDPVPEEVPQPPFPLD